jgi:hypothetical protein
MDIDVAGFCGAHSVVGNATRPIALLTGRLSALLVVAGGTPASSSRLARQPVRSALGHVQRRLLG